MKPAVRLSIIGTVILLLGSVPLVALDPSLDVSQYAHTAWTARDGFAVGAIFAMAQTPDGYLWLGSEFGLYRFDGIHAVEWLPPGGERFRSAPYSLLVTRNGTLWIGTFAGLFSWNGSKLTKYPEIGALFITSLLEDREGTVWAGILFDSRGSRKARLCAIRNSQVQFYGEDGVFRSFVWSLGEDSSGNLWASAESGLWRWKPGPPKRYPTPERVGDMAASGDGGILFGISSAGLKQVVADKLVNFPIHSMTLGNASLTDREVDSNKLLRDHDGGLWIGTHQRGLIHIHNGRTDTFRKSDGLSGDVTCSLFEDHEGNVWFASSKGLDRFRELPVASISTKQSLSSDATVSVVAATDGSIWAGTRDGLNRWKDGRNTIFRKGTGLPDDHVQSLFMDDRRRLWASTRRGLVYFDNGGFVPVTGATGNEIYSITGDAAENVWLSGSNGLLHLHAGRLVEKFPWSALGRRQEAKVLVFDRNQGGIWLGFWLDGGVLYFKDGRVRAAYTPSDGLGRGNVAGIQLDSDGVLWAATEDGLSRIKDGHVTTLTTANGLPCDSIYWSLEDNDHSFWLNTACGIVRITRNELNLWAADTRHKVKVTVWDATDNVTLNAAYYNPPAVKSPDGKLWCLGEGITVLDPHHLAFNKFPPPVHVEQILADGKSYWKNLLTASAPPLRLPARVRDLEIDYTALSLVAPEKVRFRVKLDGQDRDWRSPANPRHSHYTNLRPGAYRFRVIASNNSGVWNEQGDTLEFSIAPAYYQTVWFRMLCVIAFGSLLWAAYLWRVRELQHDFDMTLEARISERTRIARDLHDTLLQSFHGLLLRFQMVSVLLPGRPIEAKEKLDSAIEQAAGAITEGRDAVQGLRASTVERNDLALAISTLGEELQTDSTDREPMTFRVGVEGHARELHPILRDEIYKITAEALRNAFHHSQAKQVEVELHYDDDQFRLRVRDDGKGIDSAVLSSHGLEGHFGLRGMRERARLIRGELAVWSEVDSGTEVELRVAANVAYTADRKRSWVLRRFAGLPKT